MTRVCIFVDGENFRHSIVGLFSPTFQDRDYLPKQAQWTGLFDWVVGQVSPDAYRVRTYWYVIEHLDCTPYGVDSLEPGTEKAASVVRRHTPNAEQLDEIADPVERRDRMRTMINELVENQRRIRRRFEGWTRIQNGIARDEEAVEFRRAGGIRFNLFDSTFGSEKAVDVNLACDMVALKDIYDVAVVFSGDQDYVPAVRIVKDARKRVINVAFQARNGRLLPGGARRLNETADRSIVLKHADLAQYFNFALS